MHNNDRLYVVMKPSLPTWEELVYHAIDHLLQIIYYKSYITDTIKMLDVPRDDLISSRIGKHQ